MDLLVVHKLQTVLDEPQEYVCLPQRMSVLGGQKAVGHQPLQSQQRVACDNFQLRGAEFKLQRLDQELDVADAAWAELEMVNGLISRHQLSLDAGLELAQ